MIFLKRKNYNFFMGTYASTLNSLHYFSEKYHVVCAGSRTKEYNSVGSNILKIQINWVNVLNFPSNPPLSNTLNKLLIDERYCQKLYLRFKTKQNKKHTMFSEKNSFLKFLLLSSPLFMLLILYLKEVAGLDWFL